MTFNEKILYHQIHPAKLTADISGGLVSTYLLWNHQFALAMLVAFVPAILASAILLRFADLQRLKDSRFGKYIHRFMDRRIEAWRFAGQILMWFGAWHHRWWAIVVGTFAIIAAWMVGLWYRPPNDVPRPDRRRMRFRMLRIAFSAACGIVCLLLIVLWVRSYKLRDYCSIGQLANRGWAVESAEGQLAFRIYPINHNATALAWSQTAVSDDPSWPANNRFGFDAYLGPDYAGIVVPHWLVVLLTAFVAASAAIGRMIRFRIGPLKRFRHYLRVGFSVGCGVACMLLIVLWARSYWWTDGAIGPLSSAKTLVIGSNSGRFSIRIDDSSQHRYSSRWQFDHYSLVEIQKDFERLQRGPVSFSFPIFGFGGTDFFLSHWFVIIPIAVMGQVSSRPWIRKPKWRFSLRTLLIVTTLVAVVLGGDRVAGTLVSFRRPNRYTAWRAFSYAVEWADMTADYCSRVPSKT